MPFGEEIDVGYTSQRTASLNYASDEIREKFATYERDEETDLDFAQARMHKYDLGRFTSPDPALVSASSSNPQTWNRYIYVVNNPLLYFDPLGLWKLKFTNHYGKNDDGTENKKDIDYVEISLVKEEGDDVGTLADQFNIKDKEAKKMLNKLEKNDMRLSKVGGPIGKTFEMIEDIVEDFEQDIIKEGLVKASDNGLDCSITSSALARGDDRNAIKGTENLDEYLQGRSVNGFPNARSLDKEGDLKTSDIIRYAKGDKATHFATFLMFNKGGEPLVFSKSNATGPYQVGTA